MRSNFFSFKKIITGSLFISLCLLVACTKVDEAHFSQIEIDMDSAALEKLLGKPHYSNWVDVQGFKGRTLAWRSKKKLIVVELFGDRVKDKHFEDMGSPKN